MKKPILRSVLIAAMLVAMAGQVQPAGLGKLTVLSSLGQPIRAEIQLTNVAEDEESALVAHLASREAFRTANIEYSSALDSLHFAIDRRAGGYMIRVSSTQPINEPFVDMLLEFSVGSYRIVREYTFLLDPAELRQPQRPGANRCLSVRGQL